MQLLHQSHTVFIVEVLMMLCWEKMALRSAWAAYTC